MNVLSIALVALVVIAPWMFELVTFYYYAHGDSSTFFVLSGARLPFFVIAEVALSALIGFNSPRKHFPSYAAASIAAVGVLVLLLYQLCDERGCYYTGPDKLGELRLFALLASAVGSGISVGGIRRSLYPGIKYEYDTMPRYSLLLFATVPFFHRNLQSGPASKCTVRDPIYPLSICCLDGCGVYSNRNCAFLVFQREPAKITGAVTLCSGDSFLAIQKLSCNHRGKQPVPQPHSTHGRTRCCYSIFAGRVCDRPELGEEVLVNVIGYRPAVKRGACASRAIHRDSDGVCPLKLAFWSLRAS